MSQALKEIGEVLSNARERSGLKLGDIAESLKIRQRYLLAIERGEHEELPEAAYIIGYLRSYAEALGLDGNAVVAHFKEENDNIKKEEIPLPDVSKKEMRPLPLVIAASLIAAVALYAYWYHGSNEVHSKISAAVENFKHHNQAGLEGGAAPSPENNIQAESEINNDVASQAVIQLSEINKSLGAGTTIVLLAKHTTSLQILTKDNGFLLEKKLHPGESYIVPPRNDLVIRCASADEVEVYTQNGAQKALLGTLASFIAQPTLEPAANGPDIKQ